MRMFDYSALKHQKWDSDILGVFVKVEVAQKVTKS